MMAAPVKLCIILGASNAEKLTTESGMPKSVEDLSNEIKRQFDMEGDIRLQYMDSDFDNEFVNLNQISDIQDKSTVKIICWHCYLRSRIDIMMVAEFKIRWPGLFTVAEV